MPSTRRRRGRSRFATGIRARCTCGGRGVRWRQRGPCCLGRWWTIRPAGRSCSPAIEEQDRERERLFGLIEDLVKWENTTNETVLQPARDEIRETWRRTCADNADHPRAAELFDPDRLPAFHDPFAGGGALPLEAQRLGLEAHASDLNPVAVLINKAMIEIPPKFAGRPPVNPNARADSWTAVDEGGEGRRGWRRTCASTGGGCGTRPRSRIGAPVPEDLRFHGRNGAGATGPQAVRGKQAVNGDRVAVGSHGEESESGVRGSGRAAGVDVHAVDKEGQRGVRRTGDRGPRVSVRRSGRRSERCGSCTKSRN